MNFCSAVLGLQRQNSHGQTPPYEFGTYVPAARHHADLYNMPPEFDAHIADIRLSMDILGEPAIDGRHLATALHHNKGDSWHANCTPPTHTG